MEDVVLEPAAKSHTGALTRKMEAAKRIGRAAQKFQFTITARGLTGIPPLAKCSGVALQLSRGRAKTISTKPAPSAASGAISWEGEALLINATLRQSKTGKGFSDKAFKVSVVGVFDKRLRELARSEINLSTFSGAAMPAPTALHLAPNRKHCGGAQASPVLQLEIAAMEMGGGGEDSDDEAASVTTTGSDGTAATWMSASVASDAFDQEQDLAGFEAAAPAARAPSLTPIGEDKSVKFASRKLSGAGGAAGAAAGATVEEERPHSPWSSQASGSLREALDSVAGEGSSRTPDQRHSDGSVDENGMRELKAGGSPDRVGSTRDSLSQPASPWPAPGGGADAATRVLRAGWLNKQAVSAPTLLKNWRRRYIVLRPTSVEWSKAEGAEPAGSMPIHTATKVGSRASKPRQLCVVSDGRELVIEAPNALELQEWHDAVQYCVTRLKDGTQHA